MGTTAQQVVAVPAKAAIANFVWHELQTTDAAAAEEFYTHVIGWQAKDSGDPGGIPYRLFQAGGFEVTGMLQLTQEMLDGGMKPAWIGFIGVDDVDACAIRLEQAGGKLLCPPMDIPTIGRFASVEDSQGAVFTLFKGSMNSMPPRPENGAPGTVSWNELHAIDGDAAWSFYSQLFGWTEDSVMDMGPSGIYRIFCTGGPQIGGIMTRSPGMPGPRWLYYFVVEDIDAAAARLQEKNGNTVMGPHQVPGGQWIIIAIDPQGAAFGMVGPKKA